MMPDCSCKYLQKKQSDEKYCVSLHEVLFKFVTCEMHDGYKKMASRLSQRIWGRGYGPNIHFVLSHYQQFVFHKRQWSTHEWKEENQKMGPRQETFQKTSLSKQVRMLRKHFRICDSPLMQLVKRLLDQTTINWYISRLMYIPRGPSLVVGSWDTITFSNRQFDSLFDINHTRWLMHAPVGNRVGHRVGHGLHHGLPQVSPPSPPAFP